MTPFQIDKRATSSLLLNNKKGIGYCLFYSVMIGVLSLSLMLLTANSVYAENLTVATNKKLIQASQLAQNNQLNQAIDVLKVFNPNRAYDKAFVHRMLGIYYWQAEQPKASIVALRQSLSLKALEPKAQWQTNQMLGDILYSQHDFSTASREYQQTLKIAYHPNAADKNQHTIDRNELYFRIAAANYQQQQWSQVRGWLVKFKAPNASKKRQALQMQVVAELRMKQWHYAETTLTQLIRLEPNNKSWWHQQISTQLQQKKTQAALDTYALAKKQGLNFTVTDYKTLSQLYAQNRIPERGARILQEMFVHYPESKTQENQKIQAQYYQAAKEWSQAMDVWAQLAQRNAEHYWPLTQLYIQQKQYQRAIKVIDKAKPYVEKTTFGLAKIHLLYRLDKHNDALAEAKRLNETLPSDAAQTWVVYLQTKLQDPSS